MDAEQTSRAAGDGLVTSIPHRSRPVRRELRPPGSAVLRGQRRRHLGQVPGQAGRFRTVRAKPWGIVRASGLPVAVSFTVEFDERPPRLSEPLAIVSG